MKSNEPIGVGSPAASTLYDVAREAGVSTATVSRVVHGQDRVRPATRQRVLEASRRSAISPTAQPRAWPRVARK